MAQATQPVLFRLSLGHRLWMSYLLSSFAVLFGVFSIVVLTATVNDLLLQILLFLFGKAINHGSTDSLIENDALILLSRH